MIIVISIVSSYLLNGAWTSLALSSLLHIEADAFSSITETQVHKFIWKNIVPQFGLLRVLMFDKGSQFIRLRLEKFTTDLKIKVAHASVCYPK